MKTIAMLILLAAFAPACDKTLYGKGALFIWNGSANAVTVHIEGRDTAELALPPQSGRSMVESVAGPYKVAWGGGTNERVAFDLKEGQTAVVDIGAATCFARTDISGMYQAGKERVRFLESYHERSLLLTADPISVFPGDTLPTQLPRNAVVFQRLSVVPCKMLDKPHEITEIVRRER